MSNKLRILVDHDVDRGITEWLRANGRHNVATVFELGMQRRDDDEVFHRAQQDGRIVLTADRDFNEHRYPVCTHCGIVRLTEPLNYAARIGDALRRFLAAGYASRIRCSIVILRETEVEFCGPDPATPSEIVRY